MLRKFKSLFIIEDEKPASSNAHQSTTMSSPAAVTHAKPPAGRSMPSGTAEGHVSEKFLDILFEAMEQNNIEGFDYMEFREFLKSLDSVEMDEATKYRSAFATGKTMGATKDNLLSSAEHYIDTLKIEEQRFDQAARNQKSRLVDERTVEISKLEKSISDKEEQIRKLTSEIEKAREEIRVQTEEMRAADTRISQTQADFTYTYKLLVAQIQEDVRKINSYLS